MTMAGQDSDLSGALEVLSTASQIDANQASWIMSTKELASQDSLLEWLTPAAILELGLDPGNPVYSLDFDLGNLDWDSYCPAAVDGSALEACQEPNDFGDDNREEESLQPSVDVSAAQPVSRSSVCSPNTHDGSPILEVQLSSGQEPSSASQYNTVGAAELFTKNWSDLFGSLDSPDHKINNSSPANFELPDNKSGLAFLQNLQLVGGETQPAMGLDVGYNLQRPPHATCHGGIQGYDSRRLASDEFSSEMRTVSARSSEPSPGNEKLAVLTNPRRYSKRYVGGATNKDYIENSAYTPLRQAPETWDIFEYTKDGELDPSRLFSPEEIKRYLFDHPLHQGHPNRKESQLKLRVHKTPASSAKRFPTGLRCRFKDCPMHTINQGQLLVIADGKAFF